MAKTISAHCNITNPEKMGYPYLESIQSFAKLCDEVIIVDGGSTDGSLEKIAKISKVKIIKGHKWEYDFDWTILPKNLQVGYEACTKEWAFHFDTDYIFSEKNIEPLKDLIDKTDLPAIEIKKLNVVLHNEWFTKDYYPLLVYKSAYSSVCYGIGIDEDHNTKSATFLRPIAKKGVGKDGIPYGDEIRRARIRVEVSDIDIICYDFTFMTKEQITEQRYRFNKALQKYLKNNWIVKKEDSFSQFMQMMKSRRGKCKLEKHVDVELDWHPQIIREKIKNLTPEQFGYNGFGLI